MLHQFWCFWAHEKRHISVSHGGAGRAKPQLLGRSEAEHHVEGSGESSPL